MNPYNFGLYKSFWTLQKYIANPFIVTETTQLWQIFNYNGVLEFDDIESEANESLEKEGSRELSPGRTD